MLTHLLVFEIYAIYCSLRASQRITHVILLIVGVLNENLAFGALSIRRGLNVSSPSHCGASKRPSCTSQCLLDLTDSGVKEVAGAVISHGCSDEDFWFEAGRARRQFRYRLCSTSCEWARHLISTVIDRVNNPSLKICVGGQKCWAFPEMACPATILSNDLNST